MGCLNYGTFHLHYTYDLLGDLASTLNYAESSKTYTYNYDTAARLVSMQSTYNDANHPGTLLTVNQYNPLGQVQQATLGNGVVRNLQYDSRGRVTSLTDGSIYSFTLGYTSNSNILSANDLLNGNWTYSYDDFNRLWTSNKGSGQQTFDYDYDRFGNRWQQNVTAGTGPNPSYTFDANNRISGSGVVYDAAGNITNDGLGHTYTYDAENRLLTVAGAASANYVYDSIGQRVRQMIGSSSRDYVFDQAGRVITQMSPGWARSELYASWLHVATYTNNTTYFDHRDWLGTKRALSNVSGSRVETCTSLPFGDAQVCTGTDWSPLHFTGQDWDSESSLTHFLFRQLSTTEGRWTTPDPAGITAVSPANPQTWNRYAYVMNDPLGNLDPLGLSVTCDKDGNCHVVVWAPAPDPFSHREGSLENHETPRCANDMQWPCRVRLHLKLPLVLSANNGTWQTIKNIARKVGNYIPTVCGGGVFNYGGLRVSGDVASVSVSQIRMADTRSGYSEAPFADISFGEGLTGGYGQAVFSSGGNEHFFFGGVGGDVGVTKASVSVFGSHVSGSSIFQNSVGLNGDAGFLAFAGGVGVYANADSVTSCIDHGGW